MEKFKPESVINFFKNKGYKIGFDWRDVWKDEHAMAFTVAKATSIDLLQDIRNEIQKSLENGTTVQDFVKNLKPTLAQKGWWGKKEMTDPKTGETKTVQLGSNRRLKLIWDTNVRSAYAAAHWESIVDAADVAPYLRYDAVIDHKTRDEHRRWNGLILRYDDPFWKNHYPPNTFYCRCTVTQLSEDDLKRRGLSVSKPPKEKMVAYKNKRTGEIEQIPEGISPGFNFNVGLSRYKAFVPKDEGGILPDTFQNRDKELPPLPKASKMPDNAILPEGLSDTAYAKAFLEEFGADIGKPVVFKDVTDQPLVIDEGLFLDKSTDTYKLNKNKRSKYMKLLARSLKDPDEIWLRWSKTHDGKWVLKRRYIKIYETNDGSHCLTVFDKSNKGWSGETTFVPKEGRTKEKKDEYINSERNGFLAYKK